MTVQTYEIIRRIESSDFDYAMRFEPAVFRRTNINPDIIKRIVRFNRCSYDTAKVIYSTSWGAVQIMGFNLYHSQYGLSLSVGEYMKSEDAQRGIFNLFLVSNGIAYTPQQLAESQELRDRFARIYNGSVSAYSPKILQSLQALYNPGVK